MPLNSQTRLVDDYERAVAQHGIYSKEAISAADAVNAAGLELPSSSSMFGIKQAAKSPSIAGRADPYIGWKDRKFGTEMADVFGYHSELTHFSYVQQEEVMRLRKSYGKDDPRSQEAFRQYEVIRNQIARARTQGTWAETEFETYLAAPTESNYDRFIKSAEKTQSVSPLLAAPPKRPELEEERGMIFSALLFLESLSGTAIYNLRKRLGAQKTDWIEQTEADETIKEISPSQALGYTTRETRVWTPRGITGLLTDIILDPFTWISPIASVGAHSAKVLKITKAGKTAKIEKEGIEILKRQTKWIRDEFPEMGAKEAREAAESLVFDLSKRKKLLAARKYQEPSFNIFKQPVFYWSDVKKPAAWAWKKMPYYKKRQAAYKGVESQIGKTFKPFYEVGQVAGERGKDIFKQMIRRTDYERDYWGKRAKELYKKGPKWWKKTEQEDVHKQTLELIQRGVEPTDPRAYDMAKDLVIAQREMAEKEIAAGLLDPATLREGYVFRIYTPEFRKEVLEKEFGHRPGEDIAMYTRQLESQYPREFLPEMSHLEVNKWAMKEYGIKALVTDPSTILQMRGAESSRAIAMAELRRKVGEEIGIPAEQMFPVSTRMYKKYTKSQVDEMVDERYAKRIDVLQKEVGTPFSTEFESTEAVMQALASGRGYDIAKLQYVPKKTTVAAKEAQKRADRYRGAIQPFYDLFDKARKGELSAQDIKAVEQSISEERGGLFKGMRYGKADIPIDEYMELHGLRGAREVIYRKEQIDESTQTIQQYTKSIEHSRKIIESKKEAIDVLDSELYTRSFGAEHAADTLKEAERRLADEQSSLLRLETDLSTEQTRLATADTLYKAATTSIQEAEFGVMAEVLTPAKRMMAHQEMLAYRGTTTPLEWGAALPTEIGAMPTTVSPFTWVMQATKRDVSQKKLTKLIHDQDIYREELAAAYGLETLQESVMAGLPGEKRKLQIYKYEMPSGEKREAYVDEDIIKEIERKVAQPIPYLGMTEKLMRWGYTVPWPAFHARNIQGIIQQNVYRRVTPQSYKMNWDILHGDPNKVFDVPVYGKMKASELKEMYEEAGIYGKIGYIEDPMRFKELPMGPMPEIENLGRGALATEDLMRGKSIDEAAHFVRQTHFEYGGAGLTAREQKYARHAFLFYTWPKKNIELTARMLAEQPGTIAAKMKFQQAWITPEEYEQLPWWAQESYVFTGGGEFYVLDVPALSAIQLATGEGFAFSHTPLLKFYAGAIWGRDPTTGQPIGMEDMPRWAAEAGLGRFVSVKQEYERVAEGDIPWTRMAKHQVGGIYIGDMEDIPLRQAYLESLRVEWRPTEEEKIAAFEASGMRASHYETLWKPKPGLRGEVMEEPKPWWQKWPQDWGMPWDEKKPEYVGEKGILIGYSQEEWDIIEGHTLSDEQKKEVKSVYEAVGADAAAGMRVQMAAEYHAARAAFSGREPVTPQMITESYNRLLQRVGGAAAAKAHYRTYYSDEDELLGVMAFSEEEWEDVEGYKLSEEQKQWMFRKTLTPEEVRYNKNTEFANKIEGMRSISAVLFPRKLITPHALPEGERDEMMQLWIDLEEETGYRPSGAQMKWSTTTKWLGVGGVKKEMSFVEMMTYFSSEYAATQERERLMHKEYAELREDPLGKMRTERGVSTILSMSRAVKNISVRRDRMEEIENLLGVGVDR